MTITCQSSVTAEPGDFLTAAEVSGWVVDLPPAAQLTPILREHGSQRDPITVLVGLHAKWTEER